MATIEFTEHALGDLYQIAGFIAEDSSVYASNFVKNVFKKSEILVHHPKIGRKVPEFNTEEIRELIYERYRIVYRLVTGDKIDIVTIHHSSRLLLKDDLL